MTDGSPAGPASYPTPPVGRPAAARAMAFSQGPFPLLTTPCCEAAPDTFQVKVRSQRSVHLALYLQGLWASFS